MSSLFFGLSGSRLSSLSILLLLACMAALWPAHDANGAWPQNGLPIAIAAKNQIYPRAIPDGSGGVIIVWQDSRTPPGPTYFFDIYAQRVYSAGIPLWSNNGVPVGTSPISDGDPAAIPDGHGGAIIVWKQTLSPNGFYAWDIYAQRIDATGHPLWPINGILLNTRDGFQTGQRLITDGAGGAIFSWYDNGKIWARRVMADGTSPWSPPAIAVSSRASLQQSPSMASDNNGGAFICWSDSSNHQSKYDIYTQQVSGQGTLGSVPGGAPICTASGHQRDPAMVEDGSGGSLVIWRDYRSGSDSDLFMERIIGTGGYILHQWSTDGVALCNAPGYQSSFACVQSGDRFFVAWEDTRTDDYGDIYAQQFDLNGSTYWAPNGTPVRVAASSNQSTPLMVLDGKGGVIIAWNEFANDYSDCDVRAQRMNSAGSLLWHPDGVVVVGVPGYQVARSMTSDGAGAAIVVWDDSRDGDPDVYAGRIGVNGPVTGVTSLTPRASLSVIANYPNPFSSGTEVEFELETIADVTLEMFDVNGRLVQSEQLPSRPAGQNLVHLTASDVAGRTLPSGVYFLKVSASGASATRKIVVAR